VSGRNGVLGGPELTADGDEQAAKISPYQYDDRLATF
jgi:hypothetical protein